MISDLLSKSKGILGLSFQIAKTNFKLRNEGSYFGIFWYLLEPISFFIVLLSVKNVVSSDSITNYPAYLFIGIIMFNLFVVTTTDSVRSLIKNSNFLKSTKIDSKVFVISGVMQFMFSHFFEFIVLLAIGVFLGMNIFWFFFYPIILFFFCLFITGVSLSLSVFSVYVTDLKNVWTVFTRLLWFSTPIFYIIPASGLIYTLNILNPLYYFIHITREIMIFNTTASFQILLMTCLLSFFVFFVGICIFEINKAKLAERL